MTVTRSSGVIPILTVPGYSQGQPGLPFTIGDTTSTNPAMVDSYDELIKGDLEVQGTTFLSGLASSSSADVNYYVDGTLGLDTNKGTSAGAGNALQTIQAAFNKAANYVGGSIFKINVAAGTYAESLTVYPILNRGEYAPSTASRHRPLIELIGDVTTPANVTLSFTGTVGITNSAGVSVHCKGIRFNGNSNVSSFAVRTFGEKSKFFFTNCAWLNVGNCGVATDGSQIYVVDTTNTGTATSVSGFFSANNKASITHLDNFIASSTGASNGFTVSSGASLTFTSSKNYSWSGNGTMLSTIATIDTSTTCALFGNHTFDGFSSSGILSYGYMAVPGSAAGASVTGNPTSVTGTSLTDAGKAWTVNQWVGYVLWVTDASGRYVQTRVVTSNDATTLNFGLAWGYTPTVASIYKIWAPGSSYVFNNCGRAIYLKDGSRFTEGNDLTAWSYTGTTPAAILVSPEAIYNVGSGFGGAVITLDTPLGNRDYRFGNDLYRPFPVIAKHDGVIPQSATTYMSSFQNQDEETYIHTAVGNEEVYGMSIKMRVASGAAITDTFTLRVNGVDSTTILKSVTNTTSDSVTVNYPIHLVDGDLLSIKCASGASAAEDIIVTLMLRRKWSTT